MSNLEGRFTNRTGGPDLRRNKWLKSPSLETLIVQYEVLLVKIIMLHFIIVKQVRDPVFCPKLHEKQESLPSSVRHLLPSNFRYRLSCQILFCQCKLTMLLNISNFIVPHGRPRFVSADGNRQTFVSNSASVIYIGIRSGGRVSKPPPATILLRWRSCCQTT